MADKKKKIIIADDYESVLNLLEQIILEVHENSEVKKVMNAQDLLKEVSEAYNEGRRYNCIISDHNMPPGTMTGLEAIREIRKFDSEAYIIFHTSEIIDKDKKKELNIHYLKKATSIDELYSLLEKI